MPGRKSRRSSRRIRPDAAETGSEYLPKKQLPHTTSTSTIICEKANRKLYPVTGILRDISADYHVSSTVLGTGHFGCVRECRHRLSRKMYAVKTVNKSKSQRLDHLCREVYLLRKMKNRGIMKYVDCYEDVDDLHIVTELYTGGELFDRIADKTTLDGCFAEDAAAGIVRSLLKAVAFLHNNGIVHRDIKPENVLFETSREDSGIRLIDFGLARRHAPGDAPMTNAVGTAYYMAPEVLDNRYGEACDVWSVGTIAYILLCGYPPFNGESDSAIFDAIREGKYQFPAQAWSSKSVEAKSFIFSLLRTDPKSRLTAAEALNHSWIQGFRVNTEDTMLKKGKQPSANADAAQEDATARIKALRQTIKRLRISVHPRAA